MQARPSQCREEIPGHLLVRLVHDGRPRHKDNIDRLSQTGLIHSKRFSKETARPAPHHRIADAPAGNHAHSAARTCRQTDPVQDEASTGEAPALISCAREIAALFDTTLPGQSKGRQRRSVHDRNNRSNRSETFAAHPATVPEDSPSALGGIAAEETVLPFPADLRRLILSFHITVCPIRGPPGEILQAHKALWSCPAPREARE
jgi:hypothetical protein